MSEQAWSILKLRPSSPITFWPFIDFMIVSMVLTSTIPLPSVSNCWNVCQNNPINAIYKMWKNVTNHVIWVRFDVFNWSLNAFFIYIYPVPQHPFLYVDQLFLCARKSPKFCKNLVVANVSSWTSLLLLNSLSFMEPLCHQGWPTCPLGRYSP